MGKNSKILNSNGTLNIKPKGISLIAQRDPHNMMITMSWFSFILLITIFYLSINIIFTIIYLILGTNQLNGIYRTDTFGQFWETFFFSTQTFTTLGYGRISPIGMGASAVAAIESMLGVLLFAFATGLSYARFSRPNPKILYSKNMLIGPYKDTSALMVRIVNYKKNQLVDLHAEFLLTLNINQNDKAIRFFYPLTLEQSTIGMMMMSWTVIHKISEESPLAGLSMKDLEDSDAEIIVMIRGTDDILSQNIFSRTSFKFSKIIWDAEFVPINDINSQGILQIDVSLMNDYKIIK